MNMCKAFSTNTKKEYFKLTKNHWVFLLGLLFSVSFAQAQLITPVRTQVTISPPYSLNLSDYSQPNFDRFLVQIFLEDQNQAELNIALQLRIGHEGTVVYESGLLALQAPLNPGLPVTLSGNELGLLFSNGQANPLTEDGVYQFFIIAYDQATGTKLSNELIGSQIVFLSQNDPPFLNMPTNNVTVDSKDQSPLLFLWTPRHDAINTLGNVKYTLEIFRVPENMNANDVASSNSIYKVFANEFFQGEISYSMSYLEKIITFQVDAISNPQNRYAWRVRAEELDAVNNTNTRLSLFKNGGYSEVFTFFYNTPCNPPTLLDITADAPGQVAVSWLGEDNHTGYELLYKVFQSSGQYQVEATDQASNTLTNLESATTYEIAVRTYCNGIPAPIKVLGNITTQDEEVEPCVPPTNIKLNKTAPVDAATPGSYTLSWDESVQAITYDVFTTLNPGTSEVAASHNVSALSLAPQAFTGTDLSLVVQVNAVCEYAAASGLPITFDLANGPDIVVEDPCLPSNPVVLEVAEVIPETVVDETEVDEVAVEGGSIDYELTWNSTGHTGFKFRYRERDNATALWIEELGLLESKVILENIEKGVNYSYQIDFVCANGNTGYLGDKSFFIELKQEVVDFVDQGTADCFPPLTTGVEIESTTEVALVWDRVSEADNYEILYRRAGLTSWTIENETSRKLELTSLIPDSEYEYQVRAQCDGEWSIYTEIAVFTTNQSDVPFVDNGCPRIESFSGTSEAHVIGLDWENLAPHTAYLIEYRSEDQNISDWYSESETKVDLLNAANPLSESVDPPEGEEVETTEESFIVEHLITNLAPGTTYDIRITAACGADDARPSRVLSFGTPARVDQAVNFNCGTGAEPCIYEAGNAFTLVADSKFTLGDFEFEVQGDPTEENGMFSGKAHLVVPYMDFAQVEVDFKHVMVNAETQCAIGDATIVKTVVRVIPASLAADIQAILDIIDGLLATATEVTEVTSETLDQIDQLLALIETPVNTDRYADMNAIEMFDEGKEIFDDAKESVRDIIANPLDGDNYVTTLATVKEGAALIKAAYDKLLQTVNLDATPGYAVYFQGTEDGAVDDYFDAFETTGELAAYYQQLDMADDDATTYYVPYVAISKTGQTGDANTKKVYAVIDIADFDFDKLSFTTSTTAGQIIRDLTDQATNGNSPINDEGLAIVDKGTVEGKRIVEVTVPSDKKQVYALYETSSGKKHKLGKLNVVETEEITQHVIIVTNGSGLSLPADIKAQLETIYAVPEIKFEVHIETNHSILASDWDDNVDGVLTAGDHAALSLYSSEMKSFRNAFVAEYTPPSGFEDAVYLFAVAGFSEVSLLGYMPRNKDYGFIKSSVGVRTIAHELGHGVFRLNHTWEVEEGIEPDAVSNLMSYGSGDELIGGQWNQIHDPSFDLYGFDHVEDGASEIVAFDQDQLKDFCVKSSDGSCYCANHEMSEKEFEDANGFKPYECSYAHTFLSPAGTPITVTNVTEVQFYDIYDDPESVFTGRSVTAGSVMNFTTLGVFIEEKYWWGPDGDGYRLDGEWLNQPSNESVYEYTYFEEKDIPNKHEKVTLADLVIAGGEFKLQFYEADFNGVAAVGNPGSGQIITPVEFHGKIDKTLYLEGGNYKSVSAKGYTYSADQRAFLAVNNIREDLFSYSGYVPVAVFDALTEIYLFLADHPGIYSKYLSCKGAEEAYLRYSAYNVLYDYQGIDKKYENVYLPEFRQKLLDFEIGLQDPNVAYASWVSEFEALMQEDDIAEIDYDKLLPLFTSVRCLDRDYTDVLKDISQEDRIKCLSVFGRSASLIGTGPERAVADLIIHTPNDKAHTNALVEGLESYEYDGESLIKIFFGRDNIGPDIFSLNGDELGSSIIAYNGYARANFDEDVTTYSSYESDPAFLGIVLNMSESPDIQIFDNGLIQFGFIYDDGNTPLLVHPHEPITLKFNGNKKISNYTFEDGKTYITSALSAYALIDDVIFDNQVVAAKLALDAALLAVGVGELTIALKAGRALEASVVAAELLFDIANILLDVKYKDELSIKYKDEGIDEALRFWDYGQNAILGVQVVTAVFKVQAWASRRAAEQILKDNPIMEEGHRLILKETIDQAKDVIRQADGAPRTFGRVLDNVNPDLLLALQTKFKDHSALRAWIDVVDKNEILIKLDQIPVESLTRFNYDLTFGLKPLFGEDPGLIDIWKKLDTSNISHNLSMTRSGELLQRIKKMCD